MNKESNGVDNTIEDLGKAFVTKHLNSVLRQKGLMVSAKSHANQKIKEILARHYLLLVSKIEHVAKDIAKRKIVTTDIVESACNMI